MSKSDPKSIVNVTCGTIVCQHSVIADHAPARMRGLLGRDALPAGHGLLLRPAGSIHTAFMRFPIDAVFLDAELTVVKLASDLRPWRTAGASGARAVLELAAGEIARLHLAVGQRLAISDLVASPTASSSRAAEHVAIAS